MQPVCLSSGQMTSEFGGRPSDRVSQSWLAVSKSHRFQHEDQPSGSVTEPFTSERLD